MQNADLQTFARCRAMALAAMVRAGGKPAWVVAAGPTNRQGEIVAWRRPAIRPAASPTRRLAQDEKGRCQNTNLALRTQQAQSYACHFGKMTAQERQTALLDRLPPDLREAVARVVSKLAGESPPAWWLSSPAGINYARQSAGNALALSQRGRRYGLDRVTQ